MAKLEIHDDVRTHEAWIMASRCLIQSGKAWFSLGRAGFHKLDSVFLQPSFLSVVFGVLACVSQCTSHGFLPQRQEHELGHNYNTCFILVDSPVGWLLNKADQTNMTRRAQCILKPVLLRPCLPSWQSHKGKGV